MSDDLNKFTYLDDAAMPASTLDAYQRRAMRTQMPAPERLACYALGVAGEAGEVADMVKKHIGHGHELDRDELKKELGDVLRYVAGLAHLYGLPLSEVAFCNLVKLERRYPNGFSHAASKARVDVLECPVEDCCKRALCIKLDQREAAARELERKVRMRKPAAVVSSKLARNKAKVHP